jgi:hypothetical protein
MTLWAPAAIALVMSPEYLMPPSEMSGTSCLPAAAAQPATAVICGTPTPVTTRVVQIDPGPIPTFTASTPARIKSSAPSPVATFPATSSTSGWALFTDADRLEHSPSSGRARYR